MTDTIRRQPVRRGTCRIIGTSTPPRTGATEITAASTPGEGKAALAATRWTKAARRGAMVLVIGFVAPLAAVLGGYLVSAGGARRCRQPGLGHRAGNFEADHAHVSTNCETRMDEVWDYRRIASRAMSIRE
jgi:hypothetical protein